MMYSQGRKGPLLQVLINHDDAEREFAYAEPDNASLNAAKAGNWVVVSMKNDWKTVFLCQTRELDRTRRVPESGLSALTRRGAEERGMKR
jgi:hypothetical protein